MSSCSDFKGTMFSVSCRQNFIPDSITFPITSWATSIVWELHSPLSHVLCAYYSFDRQKQSVPGPAWQGERRLPVIRHGKELSMIVLCFISTLLLKIKAVTINYSSVNYKIYNEENNYTSYRQLLITGAHHTLIYFTHIYTFIHLDKINHLSIVFNNFFYYWRIFSC